MSVWLVDSMCRLIEMRYISRVNKVEVKGKEEREAEAAVAKKGGGKKKENVNASPQVSPRASPRAKNTDRDEDGKKKKRKFRLQPHEHQKFIDSSEDVSQVFCLNIISGAYK